MLPTSLPKADPSEKFYLPLEPQHKPCLLQESCRALLRGIWVIFLLLSNRWLINSCLAVSQLPAGGNGFAGSPPGSITHLPCMLYCLSALPYRQCDLLGERRPTTSNTHLIILLPSCRGVGARSACWFDHIGVTGRTEFPDLDCYARAMKVAFVFLAHKTRKRGQWLTSFP